MRLADADARLTEFARSWLRRPFAWGECDCTVLAANAIDALAGTDLGGRYRGLWWDEKSARRYQKEVGDAHAGMLELGLIEPFSAEANLAERQAQLIRGDLIMVPFAGFVCAHIAFGALCLSTNPKRAVGWLSSAEMLAWRGARVLRVP